MYISASVRNTHGQHEISLATNDSPRELSIAPGPTGYGSSVNGGELLFLALATCYCNDIYREAVLKRQSPAELGNARRDAVLDFDQVSPTLAWVKPQLEMFGGVMQDYLNIVYLDGQWWIMAKMWERVGDSE